MFTVIKNALSSVLGVHLAELVYAVKGPVIICCGRGGGVESYNFFDPCFREGRHF